MTADGCPACGGELQSLGTLGSRRHHRCRACGIEVSEAVVAKVTCAICADEVEANAVRLEPLGRNGALVRVCVDCRSDHPRTGRVPAFNGGHAPQSPGTASNGGRPKGLK